MSVNLTVKSSSSASAKFVINIKKSSSKRSDSDPRNNSSGDSSDQGKPKTERKEPRQMQISDLEIIFKHRVPINEKQHEIHRSQSEQLMVI